MKHLKLFLLCIAFSSFATSAFAAQDVYKWVDDQGVTHYGDESRMARQKGAQQMTIQTPPKIGSVPVKSQNNYVPKPEKIRQTADPVNINYQVKVISPTPEQQVRANNGVVTVVSSVNPRPNCDYSMKVFLDGSLYASTNNSMRVDLEAVARGEHNVATKMVCKNGKIYASEPVHFYVLRVAIK